MKRLVLAITLASLAALDAGGLAAPRPRASCPNLSVSCPVTAGSGQPVTYTLNVGNVPGDPELTFNWVVSAGVIASGQGTTSITVDTTGVPLGTQLTATAEVGGLPASCPNSASCSVSLPQGCYLDKIDEYGDLRFDDEKVRLDNFALELQNDPLHVGYVVGYGGRRTSRGEALRRIARAKKYLTSVRGVPAERVLTIDGGYREELTVELRIRVKGVPPPEPSPTVDPGEVVFVEPPAGRRARRGRQR